ncbi:hypothetical protein AVEN_167426-1 [Araneus ventricosus]|uniref:Uncharacterized protein n=1 Tax=Araneus ventricosus TaxID=182803 RepID=A0A4Y2EKZ9_ARAVE|nr:hypothetical protein AVEN_167426-1 [Araneus ventricosus]
MGPLIRSRDDSDKDRCVRKPIPITYTHLYSLWIPRIVENPSGQCTPHTSECRYQVAQNTLLTLDTLSPPKSSGMNILNLYGLCSNVLFRRDSTTGTLWICGLPCRIHGVENFRIHLDISRYH